MSRVPLRQSIAIYKADAVWNQSQQVNGAFWYCVDCNVYHHKTHHHYMEQRLYAVDKGLYMRLNIL